MVYEVYNWQLDLKLPVAVKIFTNSRKESRSWRRELGSLMLLKRHEHIIGVRSLIYLNANDRAKGYPPLGFAMDLMACCALEKIKEMSLMQKLNLFEDIAGALTHSHECGIVHFDVKPENILIDEKCGNAKLCDFGCAHKLHSAASSATTSTVGSQRGTHLYMAPEILDGKIDDFDVAKLCDIYSFGKTMWKLLHPESLNSELIGDCRFQCQRYHQP
jgi:serine/threonine protein kinase